MARIRTIKPESFTSESLSRVSLTAERTFKGLINHADDTGRSRGNPNFLYGQLWTTRTESSPEGVADDLRQLAENDLICRYQGCDGADYVHIITWTKHQKIDRPSPSRLPVCPVHHADHRCGRCQETCALTPRSASPVASSPEADIAGPTTAPRALAEDSAGTPRGLDEPSTRPHRDLPHPSNAPAATPAPTPGTAPSPTDATLAASGQPTGATAETIGETAGQRGFAEDSAHPRRGLDEDAASGSRIRDPGSVPTGRPAPAPDTVSAKALVGEYVAACSSRPPAKVLGHLGREINTLIAEGITAEHLRPALELLRTKGAHPSVLPSMVNQVMNATPAPWPRPGGGYQPWTNPTDASAYHEAL